MYFVAIILANTQVSVPRREVMGMPKQRRTGPKAAKAASKVLKSGSTGKASKTAAGSALSQAAPKRQTKKGK